MIKSGILHYIQQHSFQSKFPDDTDYQAISEESIAHLSQTHRVSRRNIEITALEKGVVPQRYCRNMKLFSPEDQAALLRSRVSIAGLGGLGGMVTEILARAGVGRLTLIDGDTFEESNLNRQFLCTRQNLGGSKTQAAVKRTEEINASVDVQVHFEFLSKQNAVRLISGSDVVVDCLDRVGTRFIFEKAAKKLKIPMVSAAIAGDSGHVTTILPADGGLTFVYGADSAGLSTGAEASLGCHPHAASLLASVECSEVFKLLLGRGSTLRNRLFLVDLTENLFEIIRLDE